LLCANAELDRPAPAALSKLKETRLPHRSGGRSICDEELRLADIAHRLWCKRMAAAGWNYGEAFDPNVKAHDALKRFDELDPVDRRSTLLAVHTLELIDRLGDAPDYGRGPRQELGEKDLRVGLRVAHADNSAEHGTVLSWLPDKRFPGCIETIHVRWDDGEVVDHAAAERELHPLEPRD
jgi:hypothetical protein